jgi:hypothetical protein
MLPSMPYYNIFNFVIYHKPQEFKIYRFVSTHTRMSTRTPCHTHTHSDTHTVTHTQSHTSSHSHIHTNTHTLTWKQHWQRHWQQHLEQHASAHWLSHRQQQDGRGGHWLRQCMRTRLPLYPLHLLLLQRDELLTKVALRLSLVLTQKERLT